jgi:hypothetical protein
MIKETGERKKGKNPGGLPAFGEPTTFVGGARGDQGWRFEAVGIQRLNKPDRPDNPDKRNAPTTQ